MTHPTDLPEFREAWVGAAKAAYIRSIETMDINMEPGLRKILIEAHGYTMDDIDSLRQFGALSLSQELAQPFLKLLDSLEYHRPVYNSFTPAKGEKSEPEQIWETPKSTPIKFSQILQHPENFDCVNVAKSQIIHYALPNGKKTLCGKKVTSPASNPNDPMYSICPKCKSLT